MTHILCTDSRCGEICSSPRMREMHNQNRFRGSCWARGSHCPPTFLHGSCRTPRFHTNTDGTSKGPVTRVTSEPRPRSGYSKCELKMEGDLEPWLSGLSELSGSVGSLSGDCRVTVGLSGCRGCRGCRMDCRMECRNCRVLSGFSDSDYVCLSCRVLSGPVGLSDCRNCRISVGFLSDSAKLLAERCARRGRW